MLVIEIKIEIGIVIEIEIDREQKPDKANFIPRCTKY